MTKQRSSNPQKPDVQGGKYVELVHRYDLADPEPKRFLPASTGDLAIERLTKGNARFATFMNNCRLSISGQPVVIPCDQDRGRSRPAR